MFSITTEDSDRSTPIVPVREESTASSASTEHEHTGHIECHCLHATDESVAEARSSGRIHLNSACFWSCCHARWDDFTCKADENENEEEKVAIPAVKEEPETTHTENGPHEHDGFIVCKCSHRRKEMWYETKSSDSLIHRNGVCLWSCCGENWSEKRCSGGGIHIDVSEHQHHGHIECGCCHHKNDTLAELQASQRTHLNIRCFWSCCGARWDDPICECTLPDSMKVARRNADGDASDAMASDLFSRLFGDGSGGSRSDRNSSRSRRKKSGADYSYNNSDDVNISKW